MRKEDRLKKTIGEAYSAFEPFDLEKYCYLRVLAVCYFTWITNLIDTKKETQHVYIDIMSAIKFLYPCGNSYEKIVNTSYEDIEENLMYLNEE